MICYNYSRGHEVTLFTHISDLFCVKKPKELLLESKCDFKFSPVEMPLFCSPDDPRPLTPNPTTPRLKCLNTSPLHVLVVKVRWVHGKKQQTILFQ